MGGIATPYPLNNPVLGRMLQEQEMAKRTMQTGSGAPAPGPFSVAGIPDAQPQTLGRIEHTHDIAGMGEPETSLGPMVARRPMPSGKTEPTGMARQPGLMLRGTPSDISAYSAQSSTPQQNGGLSPQPITNTGAMAGKAKVNPIQPNPAELGHQQEYNRLTGVGPDPNQGKSGISQIKNPVGRTLLQIADAVGGGLFPRIAMNIPGTQLHHNMLVRNEKGALDQEQGARKQSNVEQEEAARATEQESLPEFHAAQTEVNRLKGEETTRANQAKEDITRTKNEGTLAVADERTAAMLAQHGFKRDENGQIVPLPYEEMSEPQQAIHDLKAAQGEQAQATAALRKAQADNAPAAAKLAEARLRSAQEAHQIAIRRLGLSEMQTEGRLFGTHNGQALPGSMLTDEGTPVGTAFQQNVRPTGTERTRADLATSAHEQLNDMRDVIKRHPEFFGPGAGRKTQFVTWVGSQDPDAQKFLTARSILADHATGVFGARSEAAINAQKIAAGELKDNPDAILAGLNQIEKAMGTIRERGVVKTTGSKTAEEATAIPYTDNGKTYHIPKNQEAEFLRDHPNAKK